MKKLCLAIISFVAIASGLRTNAETGTYVYLQFSPVYAIPGKSLETRAGAGLALGAAFDEAQEIELEGTTFNTEFKPNNTSWHTERSDIRFQHLLATYRYTIQASRTIRFFFGLSAGLAHVSYDFTTVDQAVPVQSSYAATWAGYYTVSTNLLSYYSGSITTANLPSTYTYSAADNTLTRRYSGTNNVATGGPSIGYEYDLKDHSTLTLSAKWLYMPKTAVTSSGSITFIQAGYRYNF